MPPTLGNSADVWKASVICPQDAKSNALPVLLPFVPFLRDLFASALEQVLYIVEEGGNVLPVKTPRTR